MFRNSRKLIGVAIVAIIAFACKKDKEVPASERILGKWQLVQKFYQYQSGGFEIKDTTHGTADDYVEFKNDGTVYTRIDGDVETFEYKILSNTSMVLKGDTGVITKLTANELVYYYQDDKIPGTMERIDISLKR